MGRMSEIPWLFGGMGNGRTTGGDRCEIGAMAIGVRECVSRRGQRVVGREEMAGGIEESCKTHRPLFWERQLGKRCDDVLVPGIESRKNGDPNRAG